MLASGGDGLAAAAEGAEGQRGIDLAKAGALRLFGAGDPGGDAGPS